MLQKCREVRQTHQLSGRRGAPERHGCHEWLSYLNSCLNKNVSACMPSDEEVRQTAALVKRGVSDNTNVLHQLGLPTTLRFIGSGLCGMLDGPRRSRCRWLRICTILRDGTGLPS